MKVLLVASEGNPFIKTGGLGDVVGALPKALNSQGIDMRVVIPNYKGIKPELKSKMKFLKWFMVKVGWRNQYCGIFQCKVENVTYYFIDNEYYFGRDGVYGFYDDGERFAYYDRAVLEMIKEIAWKPDVIHCNDWHTGMVPVLYKLEYSKDEFYQGIKTVYSIHNILFQGIFNKDVLPDLFGYDYEAYNNGSLEFYDCINFMKGGINYADKVTTVSKSYAEEIKTSEYGEKLEGLLIDVDYKLEGIVNGIDYDEFNPYQDNLIYNKFDENVLESKKNNKIKLQEELGITINKDVPLIGIVSRLTNQKGMDLVLRIADRILKNNVQIVVLGTGDWHYEEQFKLLQYRYPDKVSVNIKFDNSLAHKIYASSDYFLMPSLFEPCGLGQLIALRYGTLPIVRETGGLKDTIFPYNQYNGLGNGFSFNNYNCEELLMITEYALSHYESEGFKGLVNQALESNNSWAKSAKEYEELYFQVMRS